MQEDAQHTPHIKYNDEIGGKPAEEDEDTE
jgi:hypothetical protein